MKPAAVVLVAAPNIAQIRNNGGTATIRHPHILIRAVSLTLTVKTQVADEYVKLRKEFGKHCRFTHVPPFVLHHIPTTNKYSANYVMRNPSVVNLDTCPHM